MADNKTAPVLFLFGTLEIGGSESKFVRLANRLKRSGKPVHVAYLKPPETLLPRLTDIEAVNLNRKGKWSLRAFRALSALVRGAGISTIVSVNLYPLCYAVPLKNIRPGLRLNVIASINTSEFLSPRDKAFMRIYTPLLRRCDRNVFGSECQQNKWLSDYEFPKERATVIYNGVESEFFDPKAVPQSRDDIRASLDIPADAGVIICVSQLRPEKAHLNLLQAVSSLEREYGLKPHILLVGEGEQRAAIVDCAQRLGLTDRLHMTGRADDVRPYLKAADVFALTSIRVETFSNAALEATAMGLPVVISDVGGAFEMFPEGSSGTVYARDDVDALARALAGNLRLARAGDLNKGDIRESILRRYSTAAMDAAWTEAIWTGIGKDAPESMVSPGHRV